MENHRLKLLKKLTEDKILALPLKVDTEDEPLVECIIAAPFSCPDGSSIQDRREPETMSLDDSAQNTTVYPEDIAIFSVKSFSSISPKYSPCTTLKGVRERGYLAPVDQSFCSLNCLSKFLNLKVIDKEHLAPESAGFFDAKRFWNRLWHLYYVWPMTTMYPIIVITECQFRDFMSEINSCSPQLDLLSESKLQRYRDVDLLIDFPDHPRFTPRYLGVSEAREHHSVMLRQVPSKDFRVMNEPTDPPMDKDDIATFNSISRGQIVHVTESAGQRTVSSELQQGMLKKHFIAEKKKKKKEAQASKNKTMNEMFKRAQQYFGMRPDGEAPPVLPRIDPAAPIPYQSCRDTVLICFDVESWERNHDIITEVGLAIFDTEQFKTTPAPGNAAQNWHKLIEAHHFRIIEHGHHRNSDFVQGNPFGFKFGDSQDVGIYDCSLLLEEMFDLVGSDKGIVLVGHAIAGDIHYLDKLGFNPTRHQGVIDTLDTQHMWKALNNHSQEANDAGLAKLLVKLDLSYGGLHNAGNDAVYTMRALLAMMVLEGTLRAER